MTDAPDEKLMAENAALRASLRAIELRIDGLMTKAFTQKSATQAVLDAIKAHCRAALGRAGR